MRFEFSHVTRYNLGQNLLIHITKILIFCTRPPKKSPQIESPFHASPIPMLFAVTPEMHKCELLDQNNFEQGLCLSSLSVD